MKTLAYVRVSTSKQADNGISLEAQEVAIAEYVSLHNKTCEPAQVIDELKILRDEGISGKTVSRRPGMLDLLAQVEHGEVSAVIVYKLDRAFRSLMDAMVVMERFKVKNVAFHSVTERLDTSSAFGRAMVNILLSFGQLEREQAGERTSAALRATKRVTSDENAALRHRKRSNKLKIGRAPYGYAWQGEEKSKDLVEHPAEMEVVKSIRRWYQAGHGYRIIAQKLNAVGYASRSGGGWHPSQIGRIVQRGYI